LLQYIVNVWLKGYTRAGTSVAQNPIDSKQLSQVEAGWISVSSDCGSL